MTQYIFNVNKFDEVLKMERSTWYTFDNRQSAEIRKLREEGDLWAEVSEIEEVEGLPPSFLGD